MRFCLFVKNSVIADKVSSVFFIPGVRTGVVAGVDWFVVTNVSLFDVDTMGLCFCVGIALCRNRRRQVWRLNPTTNQAWLHVQQVIKEWL